jgi:hypothetical protein
VSYTDLRNKILIALYQEQVMFGERDIVFLLNVAKKYGLNWQDGWLLAAQQDLFAEGLITGPGGARNDQMAGGKITGAGMRQIESQYGSKDGVSIILEPTGGVSLHELIAHDLSTAPPEVGQPTLQVFQHVEPTASTTPTFPQPRESIDYALPAGAAAQKIDSATWTGTQLVLVDAKIIAKVREGAAELRRVVYTLRIENNAESANLKGLVDALVAICEMAEPEVSVIDRIIASPKFKAYAALMTIIATIRGATGL